MTFAYPTPDGVVVTDATGRKTTLRFGLGGQLIQVRDGAGRIVNFSYDSRFQLGGLQGPGGEPYHYRIRRSG